MTRGVSDDKGNFHEAPNYQSAEDEGKYSSTTNRDFHINHGHAMYEGRENRDSLVGRLSNLGKPY